VTQPWERLPEENNRWFQRFEAFRLMGPTRSFLSTHNAERAAKGLKESPQTPGSWRKAARMYSWIERAEAWDKHLSDMGQEIVEREWKRRVMSSIEVLGRIGEEARASITDFLTISKDGIITGFNQAALKERGHLVKKISTKNGEYGTSYEIELYDGQAALFKLGQHHKLFTDLVETNGDIVVKVIKGVSLDEL
jgi:hypothetical protein